MIKFTIRGNAVPKAMARTWQHKTTGKSITTTPDTTRTWESYVKSEAAAHAPETLLNGPLSVGINFFLQKPPSIPKKRKFPDRKPDLDNLCKSICDAMEGVIYTNDSRIVAKTLFKRYGDPPRVEIEIREIEG